MFPGDIDAVTFGNDPSRRLTARERLGLVRGLAGLDVCRR